jgi:hypothetical protein
MKQAISNVPATSRNKRANAGETPARSGRDGSAKQARKPVDGRTRAVKRWRALHSHYLGLAGQQHDQLARALATLVVQRESLDHAAQRGELIDPLLLCRLSGEIRRLLARLGLDAEHEAIDATEEVIAHLRAQAEARP